MNNNIIDYGFTGTRSSGLNENQKENIIKLLKNDLENNKIIKIHHGDCIGADQDFHNLCLNLSNKIFIIIHPPINNNFRAYCNNYNIIKKEKPYLDRNKDIVNESQILIACPLDKNKEIIRSGTWSTIRYAKKIKKKVLIF